MIITRRKLVAGTAAMTLLAGCKPHAVHAVAGLTRGLNEDFEELLFSPDSTRSRTAYITSNSRQGFPVLFSFSFDAGCANKLDLEGWRADSTPAYLRLEQLLGMPATEMRVRHYCVDGWSAVASWRGVRVSEVARLAGLDSRVKYVEYRSFDSGYWSGWDLASAMHPQTTLAYEMNGRPLQANHGASLPYTVVASLASNV